MDQKTNEFYEFGPFRLDPAKRILLRDRDPVPLQLKAFQILLVLVRNGNQVVLKDELMHAAWPDAFVEEANLAQNIFVLRKTLAVAGEQRYIVTIPGRGYRFAEPVRVVCADQRPDPKGDYPVPAAAQRKRVRWVWPSAVLILIAASLAGGIYSRSHRAPKLNERDSIVVADFANSTGDVVFDGTLRQALAAQLDQSPFLNLLSDQRIAQTLSLMTQAKGSRLTPELAREVCQRTASAAVLDGSIAQVGTQYMLVVRAVNCIDGELLASAETQAPDKSHVVDALGELASKMRGKLGESLSSVRMFDAPPEDVTTGSLEALKAYSLGYRAMIARNDYPAAISLFQQATTLDPNFAMAYARLGINYYNLDEPDRAAASLQRAYELKARLSEREQLYIAASHDAMATGDMAAARRDYELWQQLYPRDQFAVGNLGVLYGFLGDYDKALSAIQEAWKLNPANALVFSNIVNAYLELDRPDEAKATAGKATGLHLNSRFLAANLYMVCFVQHDKAGMERASKELIGEPGWDDLILYYQSDSAAYEGHFSQARALTRRAVDSALRSDKKETAATYLAESAVREALVGNPLPAKQLAGSALSLSVGKDVVALAAIALGIAGDSARAEQLMRELNLRFPQDTVLQSNLLPSARLAVAIQRGEPGKLTAALAIDSPYEFGQTSNSVSFCMYLSYLRGDGYLAAHRGADAAAEFRKVLDHRGLVRNAPIGALAHLGLGRAYHLSRDSSKAKAAYQDFFSLWDEADSDLPIEKKARAEYADLQ